MMNTSRKLLLATAAVATLAAASSANAQASGSASASASVTLIEPLKIQKIDDMAFGTVTRGVGTISIAASSGAQASATTGAGAPVILASSLSGTKPAHFTITGQNAQAISWTGTSTTVQLGTLTNAMSLVYPWGTATLTGAPSAMPSATYELYVGGSQALAAGDTAGTYSGTFTVQVAYN